MKTIRQTLDAIGAPVPAAVVEQLKDKDNASYISWYDRADLLDERAPGWSYTIQQVGQLPAQRLIITGYETQQPSGRKKPIKELATVNLTYVVVQVTVPCSDGAIMREATGTDDDPTNQYGTPLDRAEASAFGRATAKLGLGRELYQGAGSKIRHTKIAARAKAVRDAEAGQVEQPPADPPAPEPPAAEAPPQTAAEAPLSDPPAPPAQAQPEAATPAQEPQDAAGAAESAPANKPPRRPTPRAKNKADWEPDSWGDEAERAVAAGNLGAILGKDGLLAHVKTIGPDDPNKPPDRQTYVRRNQVILLMHRSACELVERQAPTWTPVQAMQARDIILNLPVNTPTRREALEACKARMTETEAPAQAGGIGDYPDDWPWEAGAEQLAGAPA